MSNLSPKFRNWLRTLGAPEDPVATDTTSEWSLVSLMKAMYQNIANGSFAAGIIARAETLVSMCQSAAVQCANFVRQARASKIAAAASESSAGASADLATNAVNFAAGTALNGQRAHRDAVSAAASAAEAAASAASITADGLVLGVQVYS